MMKTGFLLIVSGIPAGIMAYHELGLAKADAIGASYPLGDLSSADDAMKQEWLERLHALGCKKCEIG